MTVYRVDMLLAKEADQPVGVIIDFTDKGDREKMLAEWIAENDPTGKIGDYLIADITSRTTSIH